LGGIENGGWKLEYDNMPSTIWKDHEEHAKSVNLMYSLGMEVKEEGTVSDVASGPGGKSGGSSGDQDHRRE
jgi:hypothetical protein